ncbi:MAG: MoaE protein [Candidatus Tokpelaia hoelldobleri]|uniref:Molybdopterin synthase catalytic subunit n=1 Tax=Candidatus Tokpelaia hoelldobleri TaxID=1902579 RepID=A0A1U9JUM8_9HYPH|nr:MAG: MoaE protein [Candidatus Tokpelaia hoelldoblerii]
METDTASCALRLSIQAEDFDLQAEQDKITATGHDIGAVVAFTGLCRDEGGVLAALELEHYPDMAKVQISQIARQACKRWPLSALTIIHRFGIIRAGEQIVLVIAASSHRHAAFEAAGFVMDYLKTDAPFWKKEHRLDNKGNNWVAARQEDQEKRQRW